MQAFSTKTKIIVVLFLVLFANTAASKNVYAQGIQGDLDADGDVDIFDYNILVENFGKTSTPTNTPTPPPNYDPTQGHTYPRTAVWQFGGAVPDWYARFDLVMRSE